MVVLPAVRRPDWPHRPERQDSMVSPPEREALREGVSS